jgi:hypothetical protein
MDVNAGRFSIPNEILKVLIKMVDCVLFNSPRVFQEDIFVGKCSISFLGCFSSALCSRVQGCALLGIR